MAAKNIAERFTEEKYATKSEVAKELKTSMVDTFWSSIQSYRAVFNRYLSIKNIERNMFMFCQCANLNNQVNIVDNKIIKVNKESSRLDIRNGDYDKFVNECKVKILKYIAREHDLEISEGTIRDIVNGKSLDLPATKMILARYLKALVFIEQNYKKEINEDFLGEIYQTILGTDNLTSFYRTMEDKNRDNRVIIDRIYTSAPINMIETMMDSLFTFLRTSTASPLIKASIAYYYINYIKPFNFFSDEVALLMSKAVLAHESDLEIAYFFPFESLLCENQEEVAKISVEVQKTCDLTYIIMYMMREFGARLDDMLNDIVTVKNKILRNDFFTSDADVKPVTYSEPQVSIEQNAEPQIVVETPVEETNVTPIKVEESKIEIQQPVKEQPVEKKTQKVAYIQEELAVSYIPAALDEKEAYRLEQHLLECDPELKKGEARFFARHCVKGKKYTIQQYKAALRCAYETARTSMDHLAELGYYQKEQVKNKYVYTPIPR